MAVNNFLVVGIVPSNNESNINVNTKIDIKFSKYMKADTVNPSNIILRKINGEEVDYELIYTSATMSAKIIPETSLEYGTQYEIFIAGGAEALLGITNDYLPESKIYRFTTTYNTSLSAPQDLATTVDNGYVSLTWDRPAQYDVAMVPSYEVMISESNDVLNAPVWPASGDLNKTGQLALNVPKRFEDGQYYAYVRAYDNISTGEWASTSFYIESTVVVPTPGGNSGGDGDIFSFNIAETYPAKNAVDITPEKVILIFDSSVDVTTLTSDSLYIINGVGKANMSVLDFMTAYAPSKQIIATIDTSMGPNIVALDVALEDDQEYTVIVRESVKSTNGTSLGMAYQWSFMTAFTKLYGDVELVKADLGGYVSRVSDKILYKIMRDTSTHAYEIVSKTANFNAADYEDGKAPYYIHQYVRHKTAYDLLMNGYIQSSSGSGSSVQLGDLSVDKKNSSTDVTSLIREVKNRIKPWEDAIHGQNNRGYAKATLVIRGENGEAYPDFLTRTEFKELGQ